MVRPSSTGPLAAALWGRIGPSRNQAQTIIDSHTTEMMRWLNERRVLPAITALRAFAEDIRNGEVDKALAQLPDLTPSQQEGVKSLSRSLANKLIHRLIQKIKESSQTAGNPTLSQIVERFIDDPEFAPRSERSDG